MQRGKGTQWRPLALGLALLWALGALGCAGVKVETTVAPVPTADKGIMVTLPPAPRELTRAEARELAKGRQWYSDAHARPKTIASSSFDYASLGLLSPARPLAKGDTAGSFRITIDPGRRALLQVRSGLLAEIEIGESRYYTTAMEGQTPVLPPEGPLPEPPPCGTGGSVSELQWQGLRLRTWSSAAVDYQIYSGTYDGVACSARPRRVATARARALIPDLLYGFRRCVRGCDRADARRHELLTLLAPPSNWVSAGVEPATQTRPHVGSFSHVTLPVSPGGSASALFTVKASRVGYFVGLRRPALKLLLEQVVPEHHVIQLTVDVVWPEGAEWPTGRVYVGANTPEAVMLAQAFVDSNALADLALPEAAD